GDDGDVGAAGAIEGGRVLVDDAVAEGGELPPRVDERDEPGDSAGGARDRGGDGGGGDLERRATGDERRDADEDGGERGAALGDRARDPRDRGGDVDAPVRRRREAGP